MQTRSAAPLRHGRDAATEIGTGRIGGVMRGWAGEDEGMEVRAGRGRCVHLVGGAHKAMKRVVQRLGLLWLIGYGDGRRRILG